VIAVNRDLIIAARKQNVFAEGLSDTMQRLPQRGARVEVRVLGPKEPGDSITPLKAVRPRQRQIDKYREPLRLCKKLMRRVRAFEFHRPQHSQLQRLIRIGRLHALRTHVLKAHRA
jgi:hypothetical protein